MLPHSVQAALCHGAGVMARGSSDQAHLWAQGRSGLQLWPWDLGPPEARRVLLPQVRASFTGVPPEATVTHLSFPDG